MGSLSRAIYKVLLPSLIAVMAWSDVVYAVSGTADANSALSTSDRPSSRFGALEQYLRTARENAAMQQTESGLLVRIMTAGAGARPRPEDTVVLTLSAKASDGSTDLPQLALRSVRLKVGDLLPGLAEGVRMIALGGRGLLVVPPSLSFNRGQWPNGVTRGMPLLFLVEVEDVIAPNARERSDG